MPAQTQLITEHTVEDIENNTAAYERYQSFENSDDFWSVKVVSVGDVRFFAETGGMEFSLPGLQGALTAEAVRIEDSQEAGLVWSGKLLNRPGYLSLIQRGGHTVGFIQTDGHYFEILPIDTSYQFLVKRKLPSSIPCASDESVGYPPPPYPLPVSPDKCAPIPQYYVCPALITILLVINTDAKDWILNHYASLDMFSRAIQESVNLAFWNSDIPNKEIRTVWVEREVSGLSPNNNAGVDLERLPSLLGSDRAAYHADIAVLLTQRTYSDGAFGRSHIGPASSNAYFIALPSASLGSWILAHELGHTLGCRHNWELGNNFGDDDTEICAHAKRHPYTPSPIDYIGVNNVGSWGTIVSNAPPAESFFINDAQGGYLIQITDDDRILHYSNPDISYGGAPTGTASGYIADNAAQIRGSACDVAGFDDSQELEVAITLSSCRNTPFTLSADITAPPTGTPGQPPYSVSWHWNTSGFFPSSTGLPWATGTSMTLTEHPNCPVYWVKCTVVSSDNVVRSRVKRVDLSLPMCMACTEADKPTSPTLDAKVGSDRIYVFPNPAASDEVRLFQAAYLNVEALLQIQDLSGRIIRTSTCLFDGTGTATLQIGELPEGAYFLSLTAARQSTASTKLLILKH